MSNFGYQVLGFGSNVNPTGGGILYSMSFPATFSSTLTGKSGPTQYTQVNRPTTDTNYFSLSNGIQLWTPPETRDYTIYMRGAVGGQHSGTFGSAGAFPGAGAEATFTMALDNTKTYAIVVGQRPSSTSSGTYNGSAGGGCSAIYENGFLGDADTSKIIGIVGGGGGTGHGFTGYATGGVGRGGAATTTSNELTGNAYVSVAATSSAVASARSAGNKGIGQGGYQTRYITTYGGSGGGAGWLSDGNNYSNSTYAGGGDRWAGGNSSDGAVMNGGFGGGGGSNGTGNAGGGGGGYTGGGAGEGWQSMASVGVNKNSWGGGAGGGTFINTSATSVTKTAGVNGTNSYSNGTIVIL